MISDPGSSAAPGWVVRGGSPLCMKRVFSWHRFWFPEFLLSSLLAPGDSVPCSPPAVSRLLRPSHVYCHCQALSCFTNVSSLGASASAASFYVFLEAGYMFVDRGGPEGREGGAQGPAPIVTKSGFSPRPPPVTRVQHVQEDNAAFPEGCHPAARPHCK